MGDDTRHLTPAEIADRTRAYVRENFLYMRPDWPLADDDPLFAGGVIDSIGVVELVGFLEREFGCTLEEDEITEGNLGSVGAIARLIHGKRNGGGHMSHVNMLRDHLAVPDRRPTPAQSGRPALGPSGGTNGAVARRGNRVVQLFRRLGRARDRFLHGSRRRAAFAMLVARRPPVYVLVVCNGNIFRSPFAAAVLQRELKLHGAGPARVESAGFTAPGWRSPPHAVAAAARRGIDLAGHTSQLVVADLARAADLIVVMDEVQRRSICERFGRAARDVVLLGDLDPGPVTSRAIEDPVDQGVEVCDRVYTRIERCIRELVRALARGGAAQGGA